MMETMTAFNLVDHLWHGVLGEPEKGLGYPRMFNAVSATLRDQDGHVCLLRRRSAVAQPVRGDRPSRTPPMTSVFARSRGAPPISTRCTPY